MKKTQKITSLILQQYEKVIYKIEAKWEQSHPNTFIKYKTFKTGMLQTFSDFHMFVRLRGRILSGEELSSFTRSELDVFRKVPRNMLRLTPVLIAGVLPGSFIIVPVLFAFPRRCLTREFWTAEQRCDFSSDDLKHRLAFSNKIVSKLGNVKFPNNEKNEIIEKMLDGELVSDNEVVHVTPLFCKKPLCLTALSFTHKTYLSSFYGLRHMGWISQAERLKRESHLLVLEGRAIKREGFDSFTYEIKQNEDLLDQFLLNRNVNPYRMSTQSKLLFAKSWVQLLAELPVNCDSLVLHLPLFKVKSFGNFDQHETEQNKSK